MNRKVEYGLMALKLMSSKLPGQLTSAKEVVDSTGGPFDATARVMQQMAQHGLLKSEHGAHGGYFIIRDLAKVSLYELVEMILGPVEVARCLNADYCCDLRASCNIQTPVAVLNRRLIDFYRELNLADLLRLKDREASAERPTVEVSRPADAAQV